MYCLATKHSEKWSAKTTSCWIGLSELKMQAANENALPVPHSTNGKYFQCLQTMQTNIMYLGLAYLATYVLLLLLLLVRHLSWILTSSGWHSWGVFLKGGGWSDKTPLQKYRAFQAYRVFLSREPPKALGSKEIPEVSALYYILSIFLMACHYTASVL